MRGPAAVGRVMKRHPKAPLGYTKVYIPVGQPLYFGPGNWLAPSPEASLHDPEDSGGGECIPV